MPAYHENICSFMARRLEASNHPRIVESRALRGGLESSAVTLVKLGFACPAGKERRLSLVVKTLKGHSAREAHLYESFISQNAGNFSPVFFGLERAGDCVRLYLEAIRPVRAWPWKEVAKAREVMEILAHLHSSGLNGCSSALLNWDYDLELISSACSLQQWMEEQKSSIPSSLIKSLPSLRRVVTALSGIRSQLRKFRPFEAVVLHGDVHTGNVLIRRKAGKETPVLLDWARMRCGSPFEDVSSWLQSLRYWEPEGQRRHDTLLAAYLSARGESAILTRDVRDAYWLASACNQLAGAALFHLWRGTLPNISEAQRAGAWNAAADCMRVIRRADAIWNP
jgi:hypothetical protein